MQDAGEEFVPTNSQAKSLLGQGSNANANSQSFDVEAKRTSTRRGIPEFSELILACRHHLLLTVFLGAVVSTALVAVAWRLTEAPYKSESLVRVRQHQDVVFTPQSSRADDAAFVRSQEELALSPQVLGVAVNDEQLKSLAPQIPKREAIEWLRNSLHVDIKVGAEVLSISSQHASPYVCQALSIAVTRAYLDEVSNRSISDRRRRHVELERAARQADRKLDQLWGELNRVASKVGSGNTQSLTIRDEIQLQAYRDYARQLRAAQLRGNELRSLQTEEQLRVDSEGDAIDAVTERLLQNHPDVAAARERIAKTELKIQQMREIVADDDSPRLARLQEDHKFFSADLEKIVDELRPQLREQSHEQIRVKLESGMVQLRKQIELNQSEKEFLHSRMEEIDTTIVRTDEHNGVQLEMSRHAVDRQTRLADSLWRSLEEFKIEGQSQPRVALMELAQLPSQANHTRQFKAALGAAGIGWMIVLLGIGCIEWRACRVRHGDDVTSHCARPVFGANSVSAGLVKKNGLRATVGANEAAASLMLLDKNSTSIPSLMVSSATVGEPRHLVSLELARVFRSFGRRTLLIDCDTSGPYLSRQLSADRLKGMLQVRPDRIDPRAYIVPSTEEGLDFMPLGISDGAPWIDPQVFQLVLLSLRDDYDAIVVNGPAMMSSAASLLLASHIDQTLFAVFHGRSRWNQLAASEQVAIQAGITVFGSVLHSGKRSAKLALSFKSQGASRQTVAPKQVTEESLQETVSAIQQDLHQTGESHRSELQTKKVPNREYTS